MIFHSSIIFFAVALWADKFVIPYDIVDSLAAGSILSSILFLIGEVIGAIDPIVWRFYYTMC
jgi:hypothetical protein